jgi:hypothetical protein
LHVLILGEVSAKLKVCVKAFLPHHGGDENKRRILTLRNYFSVTNL